MPYRFNPFTGTFDFYEPTLYVPVTVESGTTFKIPSDTQVLYSIPITNEGTIDIDGYLVHVHGVTP
jgi:hypothetical protein